MTIRIFVAVLGALVVFALLSFFAAQLLFAGGDDGKPTIVATFSEG